MGLPGVEAGVIYATKRCCKSTLRISIGNELASSIAKLVSKLFVMAEFLDRGFKCICVEDLTQNSSFFRNGFGNSTGPKCHHRDTATHRLNQCQPVGFH